MTYRQNNIVTLNSNKRKLSTTWARETDSETQIPLRAEFAHSKLSIVNTCLLKMHACRYLSSNPVSTTKLYSYAETNAFDCKNVETMEILRERTVRVCELLHGHNGQLKLYTYDTLVPMWGY